MKKCKSLLSVFMALAFAMMCIGINASFTVSADTGYSIKLTVPDDGVDENGDTYKVNHKYVLYQIFSGTLDTGNIKLSNIGWGAGIDTAKVTDTNLADINTLFGLSDSNALTATTSDLALKIAEKLNGNYMAANPTTNTPATGSDEALNKFGLYISKFLKAESAIGADYIKTKTYDDTDKTVTFDNVAAGYYLITDTALDGTNTGVKTHILQVIGDVTLDVNSKVQHPTLDKVITGLNGIAYTQSDNTTPDPKKSNTASIGDFIDYKLETTVPDMSAYDSYILKFTDTLSSGLDLIGPRQATDGDDSDPAKHPFAVTVGSTPLYQSTATPAKADKTHYVYSYDSSKREFEVTVDLKAIYSTNPAATTYVTITYSAKLNKDAAISTKTSDDGNTNKAVLEYSNNPLKKSEMGKTPPSKVTTHTTGIMIHKTDGGSTFLPGAKFRLTPADKTSDLLKTINYEGKTKTNAVYEPETEENAETNTSITLEVGDGTASSAATGTLKITGLNVGNYLLEEIQEPDGYNKLDYKIYINIAKNADGVFAVTTNKNNASGETLSITSTDSGTKYQLITIVNKSGIVLPATGGIGTTIFYIAGGSIMILAAILFVTKKIVDSKEKKNR